MAMIPLIGFAPDLDPTTPGVMVDCKNMYPTVRGFRVMRGFNPSATSPALGEVITGSFTLPSPYSTSPDLYAYKYLGGYSKLFVNPTGAWADASRTGGYPSNNSHWDFASIGKVVLATRSDVPLQAAITYSGSDQFHDVSGSPYCATVAVNSGFVMLGNVNAGAIAPLTNDYDRWVCSGYQDYTDWTPSVTTECTTGRLVETDGPIVAMVPFRDGFVAYKRTSLYYGEYVGAPDVWRWRLISKQYGAFHKRSVVDIGDRHVFLGINGLMVFDGATVTEASPSARKWIAKEFDQLALQDANYAPRLVNHKSDKVVYAFYPKRGATSSTYLERCLAFNYETGNLGFGDYTGDYITEVTQEFIPSIKSTGVYATFQDSYSSYFPSSFTTWSMGDDFQRSLLSEVKLRANQASPSSVTMTNYYRDVPESFTDGGVATNWNTDATTSISDSHRFFRLKSARWHKLKFDITGETEISAIGPVLVPDGTE